MVMVTTPTEKMFSLPKAVTIVIVQRSSLVSTLCFQGYITVYPHLNRTCYHGYYRVDHLTLGFYRCCL